MKKRIIQYLALQQKSIHALLLIVWLTPACVFAEQGLLWKIEAKDGKQSYLLGTIHSDDERITQLPAAVTRAFEASQSFTGEIDMDVPSLLKASQAMIFTDGSNLKALLEPAVYQQTVALMAGYGMPEMVVQQMKPWAVAATLSLPKPKTGVFLDLILYSRASQDGKQVHALETVEEQVGAMEAIPEKLQIVMLKDAIKQHEQLDVLIEKLIQAYLRRDLDALERISHETMQQGDPHVAKKFGEELIVKRNRRMYSRMQPRLQEGRAFIAVGALHLPGETGLLNLLREQGYRLTAVY